MWSPLRASDEELLGSLERVEEFLHAAQSNGRMGSSTDDQQTATFERLLSDVRDNIEDHMDTSRKPYQTSLFATLLYKYSSPTEAELSRIKRLKKRLDSIMKGIERSTNNRDPELAAIAFLKILPQKSDLDSVVDEPIPSPPVLRMKFEYPSYPSTVVSESTFPYGLDVPLDGLDEWLNGKDSKCSEPATPAHRGQTLVGYMIYQRLRIMAGKIVFIMDSIQKMPDNKYAKNLMYLANMARKFAIYSVRYYISHPDDLEPIKSIIDRSMPLLFALSKVTIASQVPYNLLNDFTHYHTHLHEQIHKMRELFKRLLMECEDLEIAPIVAFLKRAAKQDAGSNHLNPFALRPFLRLPHILPNISGSATDGILDFLDDQGRWQESVALISDQQQTEITQMVVDQVVEDSQTVEVCTDDIQRELSEIGVPVELVESTPLRSNKGDIGNGSSGTIRWTRTIRTKEPAAVKTFGKQRFHVNRLLHEAKIWKDLKHKNILPLLGYCIVSDNDLPGLVSPLCKYGNVRLFFERTNVTIAFKLRILNHILSGVEYLHSMGITHGDLRTQNVLLNADGEAIVCDFGISDVIEECDNLRSDGSITNARWLAYEFFDEHNREPLRIDGPSDMYSFGCLAFEVISQRLPYYDLTVDELISAKRRYEGPNRPDDVEDIYWNFMTAFWRRFKAARPTAKDGLTLLNNVMVSVFGPNSAQKIDMLFKCPMSFFCDW